MNSGSHDSTAGCPARRNRKSRRSTLNARSSPVRSRARDHRAHHRHLVAVLRQRPRAGDRRLAGLRRQLRRDRAARRAVVSTSGSRHGIGATPPSTIARAAADVLVHLEHDRGADDRVRPRFAIEHLVIRAARAGGAAPAARSPPASRRPPARSRAPRSTVGSVKNSAAGTRALARRARRCGTSRRARPAPARCPTDARCSSARRRRSRGTGSRR